MPTESLRVAFRIQYRVIGALLRRELVTYTGKKGMEFLMLMIEPMIFTVALVILTTFKNSIVDKTIPVVAFAVSGFAIMWAIRLQIMRTMPVILGGVPLLYHRYVKTTDIVLAKGILLVFSSTLSFFVLVPALVLLGIMEVPVNILLVATSWFLVQWYALAFSLIVGPLSALYSAGLRISIILGVLHAFSTGAFYMIDWFPKEYHKPLLYLPMLNACEMMRDGMFGDICTTHYSVLYIVFFNIFLTYVGLVFCRKCANRSSFYDSGP